MSDALDPHPRPPRNDDADRDASAATARSGRGGYPRLFTPWRLAHLTLPHRVIMGSMHVGLEDRHEDLPRLGAFYAERARHGAALMVTGGFAPNRLGRLTRRAGMLASRADAEAHRAVTAPVHAAGGRILAQLLHAGRYAKSPLQVSASRTRAPISPVTAWAMPRWLVQRTIADFVRAAGWARVAGYDGIEIMASEGYLINQFLAARTNHRRDDYGGSAENRRRLVVEIVRGIREAAGSDFVISVRLSMQDLVEQGQTQAEILDTARAVEAAGADLLNTGIGWHESRIPTIATSVPRAAFTAATARVRAAVGIPVSASNRITLPHTAEEILQRGDADAVTLARPFLADPAWVEHAAADRETAITPCIACNQACLDHVFRDVAATCLVNPRAARETLEPYLRLHAVDEGPGDRKRIELETPRARRRVAVVGAGPAGLAAAHAAGQRGHAVVLFEAAEHTGGQFRLAQRIPGKEEFSEALAHFQSRLNAVGVEVRLGTRAQAQDLLEGFDHVIVATGVRPRTLEIPGLQPGAAPGRVAVHTYPDVVAGRVQVGPRVAIIGAGGIGVDVAQLLSEPDSTADTGSAHDGADAAAAWQREWGVDPDGAGPGGLSTPQPGAAPRAVTLLQRKPGKIGAGLGATTGWIHRATLRIRKVDQLSGVEYVRLDDAGLHIRRTAADGAVRDQVLDVTDVVICAGQESERGLAEDLLAAGFPAQRLSIVGGALKAGEVDAQRAIDEAVRAAATL
ncbi:MAG: FAD-dependent oxidoreductase [Micrococcus sp.]|nr:FAD-dependent oxidoreductase [Micrococcus sp.]